MQQFQQRNILRITTVNITTIKTMANRDLAPHLQSTSMHCLYTSDVSQQKRPQKMENKGHLLQTSLRLRQTRKNESGQFRSYVAAKSLVWNLPTCISHQQLLWVCSYPRSWLYHTVYQCLSGNLVISINQVNLQPQALKKKKS